MISENELKSSVVAVEQHIKDLERGKDRDKHDTARLKDLSGQLVTAKIKLQVLHWCEGILGNINAQQLADTLQSVHIRIAQLEQPKEMDLFNNDELKRSDQAIVQLKTKLDVLKFVAGESRKLL